MGGSSQRGGPSQFETVPSLRLTVPDRSWAIPPSGGMAQVKSGMARRRGIPAHGWFVPARWAIPARDRPSHRWAVPDRSWANPPMWDDPGQAGMARRRGIPAHGWFIPAQRVIPVRAGPSHRWAIPGWRGPSHVRGMTHERLGRPSGGSSQGEFGTSHTTWVIPANPGPSQFLRAC